MCGQDEARALDAVFLRDVVENPTDDTPLLIYADWLMDQPAAAAQARGEFLRLEKLAERTGDRREKKDLAWRTRTLWWTHVESWLGALYDAVDHFIYYHGRLCVEISEEKFSRASVAALEAEPAWDWVTDIVVRKGSLDLLLHLGRMARPPLMMNLDVGRRTLEDGELEYLLDAGFWKGLRELELRDNWLGDSGAMALAAWPGLESVRVLDLEDCRIGVNGMQALTVSPYAGQIQRLVLDMIGDAIPIVTTRFRTSVRWM